MLSAIEGELVRGAAFWALVAGLASSFGWGLGCLLFDRLQTGRNGPSPLERRGIKPPTAAAMNLFKNSVACTVFLIACWVLGATMPSSHASWMLFLSGIAGFAIGDAMYFAAFPKAGVQLSAMIGNLTPPLAALLSWLFLDEMIAWQALAWMAVVVFGISLVVLDPVAYPRDHDKQVPPRDRALGIMFALTSAVAQAVGIVMAHSAMNQVEVLPATVWRLLGGIALAMPIAILLGAKRGERAIPALQELTRPLRQRALFLMLLVPTFVATILCLPLHSFAVRGAPSHLASLVLSTSPLFILPLGPLFHARFGRLSVIGTLIGFGGLAGVLFS